MNTNIPIFEAYIGDEYCGIYKISLVDLPAVESNFVAFNKNKHSMKFSIDDEEQHMVTGVIMRANFLIYRYDPDYGEYYIKYSAETIKKMAEKMMVDGTFNKVNLMHMDGTDVEGVNLVELFIKDTNKGINPAGFDDIENGSLFATYKVNNEAIWDEIKAGTFAGFSLEGFFDIERQQFRKTQKNNSIIMRLFNKFMKSFVKCGSMTTVDGKELFWVGEADLQIGDELFYNTENEEAVKVEDGTYELSDGTTITVDGGLVSEIKEADGKKEDSLDNEEVELEDETPTETEVETPAETEEKVDELKAEIEALKAEIEAIKAKLEELVAKPAAEPVVEEYNKVNKKDKVLGGIPEFGSCSRLTH